MRLALDDGCEWTRTKLVHEIVSNLESLRGCTVEWKTNDDDPERRSEFVRIHAPDGAVFRLALEYYGDYWSEEFDQWFDQ